MKPQKPPSIKLKDLAAQQLFDRRTAHELPYVATVDTRVLDADHAMDWCLKTLPSHDWAWDISITNDLDERWRFYFRNADDAARFTLTWG